MLRVGLTGGIGAGKSAVAERLAARGAVIIDADLLAREVVAPGCLGYDRVLAEFGPDVVAADGSLDRKQLADIVFHDPELLRTLNAIVHPLVAERSAELADAAPDDAVLVFDVPLLAENSLQDAYDVVVVVDAPDDVRLRRLAARGMTESDGAARMASQASREDRLEVADFVIRNSGSLPQLDAAVDDLWQQLMAARR